MIAVNTKQKMKSVAYWYSNSFSEGLKQTPCNHAGQRRGKKKTAYSRLHSNDVNLENQTNFCTFCF